METEEKPTAAFVLSLIGGIFILLGGLLVAAIGGIFFLGLGILIAGLGLTCGILVLVGAVMLYVNSEKSKTWGSEAS